METSLRLHLDAITPEVESHLDDPNFHTDLIRRAATPATAMVVRTVKPLFAFNFADRIQVADR